MLGRRQPEVGAVTRRPGEGSRRSRLPFPSRCEVRAYRRLAGLVSAAASVLLLAAPATAHSYAATVYANLTEPEHGLVRAELDMEYVLLATDGARAMGDAAFEQDAYDDVQASGQDPTKLTTRVMEKYADTVRDYVLPRFAISVAGAADDGACPNRIAAPYSITFHENVPHAHVVVEADCRSRVGESAATYRITTELFPGTAPGGQTTTVVTYDLEAGSGVASLDTDKNPTMTTDQDWGSRMGEFFVLGAEHLFLGVDHLLFLLALIVASRRLRDILVAATAFTVAHSVTFVLAALGVVSVPAVVVEPLIALSIAVVALWHLAGQWRERRSVPGASPVERVPVALAATDRRRGGGGAATVVLDRAAVPALSETAGQPVLGGLTRADWVRVGIVFAFGLVHGIGFAGALGIDEQFAWGLLGALLVFNLGIEAAQFTIILAIFPLLLLLGRRVPRTGAWVAILVSAGVAVVGLIWFVERIFNA